MTAPVPRDGSVAGLLELVAAFVRAARSAALGEETAAVLVPPNLAGEQVEQRVQALVAVGALVTGATRSLSGRGGEVQADAVHVLTNQLIACGAALELDTIELLTAKGVYSPDVLREVLHELVARFAARYRLEPS